MFIILFFLIPIIQEGTSSQNGPCQEDKVYCPDVGSCIDARVPCVGHCLSKKYPKLWSDKHECVAAIKCRFLEWQCGKDCISIYEKCNGKCRNFFWDCKWNASVYSLNKPDETVHECLSYLNLCDDVINCEDGSDESSCPQGCRSLYGHGNGIVSCNGKKACGGDPCEGKCLLHKEWACAERCIDQRTPCGGKCLEGGRFPSFCKCHIKEENFCESQCIRKATPWCLRGWRLE